MTSAQKSAGTLPTDGASATPPSEPASWRRGTSRVRRRLPRRAPPGRERPMPTQQRDIHPTYLVWRTSPDLRRQRPHPYRWRQSQRNTRRRRTRHGDGRPACCRRDEPRRTTIIVPISPAAIVNHTSESRVIQLTGCLSRRPRRSFASRASSFAPYPRIQLSQLRCIQLQEAMLTKRERPSGDPKLRNDGTTTVTPTRIGQGRGHPGTHRRPQRYRSPHSQAGRVRATLSSTKKAPMRRRKLSSSSGLVRVSDFLCRRFTRGVDR